MKPALRIDLETYSSVDIKNGVYAYTASPDFQILMLAYCYGAGPMQQLDLIADVDMVSGQLREDILNPEVEKRIFNAQFERVCLSVHLGQWIDPQGWSCTSVASLQHGLHKKLATVTDILKTEQAKDSKGSALIRYFSIPCKPTKANGQRKRNYPHHSIEKWEEYKAYNVQDVVTEMYVDDQLSYQPVPNYEQKIFELDQRINDRGVRLNMDFVNGAVSILSQVDEENLTRLRHVTGLDNPNSLQQLSGWLADHGAPMASLDKEAVTSKLERLKKMKEVFKDPMSTEFVDWIFRRCLPVWEKVFPDYVRPNDYFELDRLVKGTPDFRWVAQDLWHSYNVESTIEALELRLELAKASVKKFKAMQTMAVYHPESDQYRIHGAFIYYGANRTGRWAGSGVQLQNMTKHKMPDEELNFIRDLVIKRDLAALRMVVDDVPAALSELVRTAFEAAPGCRYMIADYSAIEARVLAWIAQETWRLEVFAGDGKIYEASAAMMFNVPVESITKGSPLRQSGKVAELALGYQGSEGAIAQMDYDNAIPEQERMPLVRKWRAANRAITAFWYQINDAVVAAIERREATNIRFGLCVYYEGSYLVIQLPTGRKLMYYNARIDGENQFGKPDIVYEGFNDNRWNKYIRSYGGKFTENIVQAIARDCLAWAMVRLDKAGYAINMHVHDEIVAEVPHDSDLTLERMCEIMAEPLPWAPGLFLPAEGYETKFYRKD